MDSVSHGMTRTDGDQRRQQSAAPDVPAAGTSADLQGPPRGDAPAWRAAAAGLAFGLASVVWSSSAVLPEWTGIIGTLGLLALGLLSMAGLRFVVDRRKARRNVFYAGEGQPAWFLVNFLGVFQIPYALVAPLADDTARALVAAALGVVVAVANQAIIGRCMTRRAQPAPEPVPLG